MIPCSYFVQFSGMVKLTTFYIFRAYFCGKCKKLFDTVLVYNSHLNTCKGLSDNFNFELIVDELNDNVSSSSQINIINVLKADNLEKVST